MISHIVRQINTDCTKGELTMNMQEASRIILGLRAAGWDGKSINDFILWIGTGEEQYRPTKKEE